MTIDEAIAHEKEVAKEIYVEAMLCHANPDDGKLDGCIERGKYHEHLAEWLEELKDYRENSNSYNKEDIELNRNAMYNKAIDNFVEHIRTYYTLKQEMGYVATTYKDLINYIFELAEQLKAGGIDETI